MTLLARLVRGLTIAAVLFAGSGPALAQGSLDWVEVGLVLDGPHPALLAQGDDELGALAGLHAKLFEAKVNVFASTGVTDGRGSYGYVLYVRPHEYDNAARALGL